MSAGSDANVPGYGLRARGLLSARFCAVRLKYGARPLLYLGIMGQRGSTPQMRLVLCRTCANFIGRRAGQERRRQVRRLCAAGMQLASSVFQCESWIPVTLIYGARSGPQRSERA
jgi:hypothetical protein